MADRRIFFEKVFNCRDLGGIVNREGKTIRSGRMLRSALLVDATAADVEKLRGECRLATIIDLRTQREKDERPDAVVPGTEVLEISIFNDVRRGVSHEQEAERPRPRRMPSMEELYRLMLDEIDCRTHYGQVLRAIMTHDYETGSVLWHCTEGKDRCGLVSAMVLMALGVDRDEIMADYLMTNLVNEAKAEAHYQRALAEGRSEEEALAFRNGILAKESYLLSALNYIDETYADEAAFLRDGLELPDELLERFRADMLV